MEIYRTADNIAFVGFCGKTDTVLWKSVFLLLRSLVAGVLYKLTYEKSLGFYFIFRNSLLGLGFDMIFLEGKKANYKIATTRGFKQVSTIPSWFCSPYCPNNKRQGQDKFFTSVWHTRWDRIKKKNGKKVIPQNHTFERLDSSFFFLVPISPYKTKE